MSGQQFLETLRQIGYPKVQNLSARTFDWMFEEEAVLPFLSWFCNTVGHQNVLNPDEKQAYLEMEQSGEGVLDEPLLSEALQNLTLPYDRAVTMETLQEDIEDIEKVLERQRERKDQLVKSRNTLNRHFTGLNHRLSKFSDVQTVKKQQYHHCLENCHRLNAECNASLMRLGECVQRLCDLYTDQGQSERVVKESDMVFLSQLSLEAFDKAEEIYTKELTNFTKKLFFDGIADIAGGELSRYQLLEVSHPTSLLVKGQSPETFLQDCHELARLQAIYPKSEGDRIEALVQSQCAVKVSQAADSIWQSLQHGSFPSSAPEIRQQIQEVKASLCPVSEELKKLAGEQIVALIRELGTLQGTSVLTGDYRLKLARQDYFTSNQDQVIKNLVEQRARNEFLTMAYELEARNHRNIHHLLTAVEKTLQERLIDYQSRMRTLDEPALSSASHKRETIDTRDTASTHLHHILNADTDAEQQLFLAYSSMVEAAEKLHQSHDEAKAGAASITLKYQEKVQRIEKELQRCEETLYADCSTLGGEPALIPRQLLDSTTQLDDMLNKLHAAILDIVTEVNSKKKALKLDVLLNKERELFTYFHLHPERLKQTVLSLETRLRAQSLT